MSFQKLDVLHVFLACMPTLQLNIDSSKSGFRSIISRTHYFVAPL